VHWKFIAVDAPEHRSSVPNAKQPGVYSVAQHYTRSFGSGFRRGAKMRLSLFFAMNRVTETFPLLCEQERLKFLALVVNNLLPLIECVSYTPFIAFTSPKLPLSCTFEH